MMLKLLGELLKGCIAKNEAILCGCAPMTNGFLQDGLYICRNWYLAWRVDQSSELRLDWVEAISTNHCVGNSYPPTWHKHRHYFVLQRNVRTAIRQPISNVAPVVKYSYFARRSVRQRVGLPISVPAIKSDPCQTTTKQTTMAKPR